MTAVCSYQSSDFPINRARSNFINHNNNFSNQLRQENIYWSLEDEKNASDSWRRIYKADIGGGYNDIDTLVDIEKSPLTFSLDKTKRTLVLQQIQPNGKIVYPVIKPSESELIMSIIFNPTRYPVSNTETIGHDSLYRVRVSVNKKQRLIVLRVYINCDELERLLSYSPNMVAPAQLDKLITELGIEITNRPDTGKYYNLLSNSIKTAIVPKLTTGLAWTNCVRKTKSPFEYQKANVDWMSSIEKGADMKFNKIDYVDYIGLTQYNLRKIGFPGNEEPNPYKVYKSKDGLLFNDESLWSASDSAILNGGVLCDEVGLGKTLSMVGLILRNPVLPTRFAALPPSALTLNNQGKAIPLNIKQIGSENVQNAPKKIQITLKAPISSEPTIAATQTTPGLVKPVLKVPPPILKKSAPDLKATTLPSQEVQETQEKVPFEKVSEKTSEQVPDEDKIQKLQEAPEKGQKTPEKVQEASDTSSNISLTPSELDEVADKPKETKPSSIFKDKYDGLFKSVATLVIVPARLCQQWEDEIYSYVEPHHKINVIKITTIVQLRNYDYKDLQNADVVIVSYPFLINKNYTTQDELSLHKIFWHRVVLDEAHEVLFPTSKKVMERSTAQAIFSFRSTYRWCVTGDPLAHTRTGFEGILMFLANIQYGDTRNGLLQTMETKTMDHILERYFRRNTKASTKEQIVIPGIREVVKYLTFSKTERAIYDNVPADDHKRKLQLCTNILISDKDSDIIGGKVVTMENINNSMKDHYVKVSVEIEDEIAETIRTYDEWQIEYPLLLKELQEKMKPYEQIMIRGDKLTKEEWAAYEELKDQKPKLQNRDRYREKATKEKLLKLRGDLKDTQEQIKIFTELNASNFKDKPCQICNETITADNKLCLNPCGHMNCAGCIDLIFNTKTNSYCPVCRKSFSKASVQTISTSTSTGSDKDKDKGDKVENPILDRWGTKMAYLIEYLKEVLKNNESRVILFSQWNQMLEMVSMVLAESRIQHVFCKGNVHMITKSISKFKTDPTIRVIMLSSESCSSGNNLTEASNIILLDTPNTDKEAALAIENQAIGRLVRLGQARTVEVVRMIIKDTIEEEYFKRNHGL